MRFFRALLVLCLVVGGEARAKKKVDTIVKGRSEEGKPLGASVSKDKCKPLGVSVSKDKTLFSKARKSCEEYEADGSILAMTFAPWLKWLVVATDACKIQVMDVETKEIKGSYNFEGNVLALMFLPWKNWVVTATDARKIEVWNMKSNAEWQHKSKTLDELINYQVKPPLKFDDTETIKLLTIGPKMHDMSEMNTCEDTVVVITDASIKVLCLPDENHMLWKIWMSTPIESLNIKPDGSIRFVSQGPLNAGKIAYFYKSFPDESMQLVDVQFAGIVKSNLADQKINDNNLY